MFADSFVKACFCLCEKPSPAYSCFLIIARAVNHQPVDGLKDSGPFQQYSTYRHRINPESEFVDFLRDVLYFARVKGNYSLSCID